MNFYRKNLALSVSKVNQLVGVSKYKIWAMLDKYVEQALSEQDLQRNSLALDTRRAGEDSIAIRRDGATPYQKLNYDETSIAGGHSYIALFVALCHRRTIHVNEGKGSDTVNDFVVHLVKQNGTAEQIKF
ncbi:MAG: hypothetical protein CR974_02110 [Gammaproteobacteria bacterium]|nr:MAG: hypothetical protein CR974_02110 [Gammaproteobacteria bacterium]